MALLKIARMGHPILLKRAEEVEDPTAPEIKALIRDMIETMHDASGVGLAAPQIHVSKRIFVYYVPAARSEGEGDPPTAVNALINPVLSTVDDEMIDRVEGCLSIPGLRGKVPRYSRIRYAGFDKDGAPTQGVASGFLANVLQHEYDHLEGILYPMRMTDLSSFGFNEELMRYGASS